MVNKIGRNDPCWCGSGIKYKKCHLDRHEQEPIKRYEASKELRQAFSLEICSAPSEKTMVCSKKIARAHTVPRSASLQAIARDGHVYGFIPTFENLDRNQGRLVPELIGINRASTFTGFCTVHDDSIFAPIEKIDFAGTAEQCFLLAYRAQAREYYTKHAMASLSDLRRQTDKGRPLNQQLEIQAFANAMEIGVNAGVRDSKHYKRKFDEILRSSDFRDVRAYLIALEGPPPVMCSGGFFPEEDFQGAKLQDVAMHRGTPDVVTVSSFASRGHGYVVLSWLQQCDGSCLPFVRSLHNIPDEDLAPAILRMFFQHIENVFMMPDWWEGLPDKSRRSLIDRMACAADFFTDRRDREMLTNDGLQCEPWRVVERRFVGF